MNKKNIQIAAILITGMVILGACATRRDTRLDKPQMAAQPAKPPAAPSIGIAESPQITPSVFLPVITARYPLQNIFGVGVTTFNTAGGFEKLPELRTTWIRNSGLAWSAVEPAEGNRNWAALAGFELELINASKANITPLIVVNSTPTWAQKVAGSFCGPVAPAKYAAFASFMRELVARYSVAPYNVTYWEIGNEPDVDTGDVDGTAGFGCWGDKTDDYYGGREYASALKAVYPAIKAANPAAQLLIGGLLMDSPVDTCPTNNCPARFFEGILKGGGGAAFDGVNFHGYDDYIGALGKYASAKWGSAWNTSGPSFVKKLDFLRKKLQDNGITDKYFINSETALICRYRGVQISVCQTADFENTKAYFVPQSYATSIREGLRANIWYDLRSGWNFSSLLDSAGNPLPAYTAMKVARTKLQDAVFVREFAPVAGVKAFEFTRGAVKLWVVWSLDGVPHILSLTPPPNSIQDALGTVVAPVGSIEITVKPLYIEWGL